MNYSSHLLGGIRLEPGHFESGNAPIRARCGASFLLLA
jgi:hypothetical protein